MAGFSLGGGSHAQGRQGGGQEEGIPQESLFLYAGGSSSGGGGRNEEIPYSRGFELWQQQAQRQQHQLYSSAGLLGFSDEGAGMQGGSGGSSSRGTRGSGGAGMSCQDCGNQAKKDCTHLRCRTCCKSRGFPCPTHVKSTWVPASKRRERQQQLAVAATVHPHHHQAQRGGASGSGAGGEPSKRPREISTRLPTTITTTTSGGGMDAANFPAEVSSPAVFRCVRVSPMDEAEDEYAYQTAVSIGGHVFKGLLYDQGPDAHYPPTPRRLHHGESSSTAAAAAITTAAAIASTLPGGASAVASASAGLLDPSSLYPTPLSAFMAGTQFFPHHPRP